MIDYKDFVPKMIGSPGFLGEPEFETLQDALQGCNAFIEKEGVRLVSVETVVLPNLYHPHEEGSEDVNIRQDEDYSTPWNQFIRLWYERN